MVVMMKEKKNEKKEKRKRIKKLGVRNNDDNIKGSKRFQKKRGKLSDEKKKIY